MIQKQVSVAKNGKVIFNKAYGFKTYEKKDPILRNNIYDVASLTKILSSLPLLMHEYEKEAVDKETTLSKLFPNNKLKINQILIWEKCFLINQVVSMDSFL